MDALGPGAGVPRRIATSRVSTLADAQVLHASADEIEASGLAPGFPGLLRDTWRDRGFGDFWGYALVAEGAAEATIEVGPHSWDLAAPSVIVEEAGGRFTDLRGVRSIHNGHALATNGLVHDAIEARLADEAVKQDGRLLRELVVFREELLELIDQQDGSRQAGL